MHAAAQSTRVLYSGTRYYNYLLDLVPAARLPLRLRLYRGRSWFAGDDELSMRAQKRPSVSDGTVIVQ